MNGIKLPHSHANHAACRTGVLLANAVDAQNVWQSNVQRPKSHATLEKDGFLSQ